MQKKSIKKKLAFVVSSPMTVEAFLLPHIRYLSCDFDITVFANFVATDKELKVLNLNITFVSIRIERNISFLRDILGLIQLARYFFIGKYTIVHSVSPKAGLLAAVAGFLAGVPFRFHTFTGQVWANKQGPKRYFFQLLDKLIGILVTRALVDSSSQRKFLTDQSILSASKSVVLGYGSVCGVDVGRFSPNSDYFLNVRECLGVDPRAVVITFVGRFKREKGIIDLVNAFSNIVAGVEDVELVLVGPDEEGLVSEIEANVPSLMHKIHILNYTEKPEEYMCASDIFVLPSYREGFGSSVIEAAACGVPSVVSDIYGLKDSILPNSTGLVFHTGSVDDLTSKLSMLVADKAFRMRLGEQAMHRARNLFSSLGLCRELCSFYQREMSN